MKKSVLVFICIFAVGWILLNSNANGAGFSQGTDRTGSPIENSYCGDCHGTGKYNPTVELTMLDGTNPITSYTPGKKYTMQLKITASTGSPAGYGYQATVLEAKGNAQAGAFGPAPSGQRVITLGGRQYAEQTRRSISNVFQMPWTAPASGMGNVTVYATGMAVNGDSGTGNDNPVKSTLVLSEAGTTRLADDHVLTAKVKVYPNPVVDYARIEISGELEAKQLSVNLLDALGRKLQSKSCWYPGQKAQLELDTKTLPAGMYWLQISDGKRIKTVSLLK